MSDPVTAAREITELEFEQVRGRLGALELLMSQAWVAILNHVPDEHRDTVIEESLVQLENRFVKFHPIAARAALESSEGILNAALVTTRQPGAEG